MSFVSALGSLAAGTGKAVATGAAATAAKSNLGMFSRHLGGVARMGQRGVNAMGGQTVGSRLATAGMSSMIKSKLPGSEMFMRETAGDKAMRLAKQVQQQSKYQSQVRQGEANVRDPNHFQLRKFSSALSQAQREVSRLDMFNEQQEQRCTSEPPGAAVLNKRAFGGALAAAAGLTVANSLAQAGVRKAEDYFDARKAEKVYGGLPRDFKSKSDRENFEVIKQYSPTLAHNPTVLRTELNRMRQMGGMAPREMVSSMIDTQRSKGQTSAFNDARQGINLSQAASAGVSLSGESRKAREEIAAGKREAKREQEKIEAAEKERAVRSAKGFADNAYFGSKTVSRVPANHYKRSSAQMDLAEFQAMLDELDPR